jgi:hypothetical protein
VRAVEVRLGRAGEDQFSGERSGAHFAFGHNLAIPIVAHGMQDTIDAFLIYSGNYPGLN